MPPKTIKIGKREFVILPKRDFEKLAEQANRRIEDEYWTDQALRAEATARGCLYALREACKVKGIDLVLMDIHLPGIDGPEATRRILANAVGPKAPPIVFLLSTYEAVDYASQTVACGAAAYLRKPEFGKAALMAAWAAASNSEPA